MTLLHPVMIESESETLENTCWIAHARQYSHQLPKNSVICPTGLLTPFYESANNVAMIKHSFFMYIVSTQFHIS